MKAKLWMNLLAESNCMLNKKVDELEKAIKIIRKKVLIRLNIIKGLDEKLIYQLEINTKGYISTCFQITEEEYHLLERVI